MATLANQTISSTYDGLIKTSTDQPVPISGVQLLEDGVGNSLALSVGRANQGATVTGTLTATSLAGTLSTAAQPNITSVGTLTSLNVGNISMANSLPTITMTDTDLTDVYSRIRASAGGLLFEADEANQQADTTIRFEIDGSEKLRLDVDGNLGLNTSSPLATTHIKSGTSGFTGTLNVNYDDLAIEGSGNTGITILTPNNNNAGIAFSDEDAEVQGLILYGHSDNFMAFRTAGSERLRITSAGRIGIGEPNPAAKIHINSGTENIVAVFESTDTEAEVQFIDTTGTAKIKTRNDFRFEAGGSEKMRLDSSGNVGIGTSSPASSTWSRFLQIEGTYAGLVYNSTAGGTPFKFSTGVDDNVYIFRDETNAATRMVIDSSGNVGIGTNTITTAGGSYKGMQIKGSSGASLVLSNTSHDNYIYTGSTTGDFSIEASSEFRVRANGAERLRITSAGNVGIGTASPSERLEVNGNIELSTSENTIQWQSGNGIIQAPSNLYIRTSGAGGNLLFQVNNNEKMRIDSSGRVGIKCVPDRDLDIQNATDNALVSIVSANYAISGLLLGDTDDDDIGGVLYNNSANYMYFQTNATERMRITSGGGVAIGRTTASAPLHIEAQSGGGQIQLQRVNAYAQIYMGGVDSNATELYVVSGGLGGVKLSYNTTSWASASDLRLKNINHELSGTLGKLDNIRAVNFSWKEDESNTENLGVIAQEVEAEFPQLVSESSEDGMKSVRYTEFVPILIAAIKELKAEVETLKSQINA